MFEVQNYLLWFNLPDKDWWIYLNTQKIVKIKVFGHYLFFVQNIRQESVKCQNLSTAEKASLLPVFSRRRIILNGFKNNKFQLKSHNLILLSKIVYSLKHNVWKLKRNKNKRILQNPKFKSKWLLFSPMFQECSKVNQSHLLSSKTKSWRW